MSHKTSQKSRHSTPNSRVASRTGRSSGGFQPSNTGAGTQEDSSQESEGGYLSESAMRGMRDITEGHEGQAVVAALATGFSIGVAIGLVIAGSHRKKTTAEDLVSRVRAGADRFMPAAISKRMKS